MSAATKAVADWPGGCSVRGILEKALFSALPSLFTSSKWLIHWYLKRKINDFWALAMFTFTAATSYDICNMKDWCYSQRILPLKKCSKKICIVLNKQDPSRRLENCTAYVLQFLEVGTSRTTCIMQFCFNGVYEGYEGKQTIIPSQRGKN